MFSGAGFVALRFFTGLAEAPFFPGITLSRWIRFLPHGGFDIDGMALTNISDFFLV